MPKKLDYDNPIRLIREALELTQPEFAVKLGISESHLQKLELGKKKISEPLAALFALRYGVDPASLKPKGEPEFFFPTANSSSRAIAENLPHWAQLAMAIEQASMESLDVYLFPKLRLLVAAAVKNGKGMAAIDALDRAAMKIAADLDLDATIEKMVSEKEHVNIPAVWMPFLQQAPHLLRLPEARDPSKKQNRR